MTSRHSDVTIRPAIGSVTIFCTIKSPQSAKKLNKQNKKQAKGTAEQTVIPVQTYCMYGWVPKSI